jgi:hypothetical protein
MIFCWAFSVVSIGENDDLELEMFFVWGILLHLIGKIL